MATSLRILAPVLLTGAIAGGGIGGAAYQAGVSSGPRPATVAPVATCKPDVKSVTKKSPYPTYICYAVTATPGPTPTVTATPQPTVTATPSATVTQEPEPTRTEPQPSVSVSLPSIPQ